MKKLSFRIRKCYYDQILSGEKTVEYRKMSSFWIKRLGRGFMMYEKWFHPPFQAVFICGKKVHRREVSCIERIHTPEGFSDQGKQDVDTPTCLAFYLGKEVVE